MLPSLLCHPYSRISNRNKLCNQSTLNAAAATYSHSPLSLLCSLSALDDPAVDGAALIAGYFSPIFPCREGGPPALHDGQDPADPMVNYPELVLTAIVAVSISDHSPRLPSWISSLWVVYLANRDNIRHCRPSDNYILTSRHHQSGQSRGEISSTPGCLSPQNPHPSSIQRPGISQRGIACIYLHYTNKHACMLSLGWAGLVPMWLTIKPSNPAFQCLAASDSWPCKYSLRSQQSRTTPRLAPGSIWHWEQWWRVVGLHQQSPRTVGVDLLSHLDRARVSTNRYFKLRFHPSHASNQGLPALSMSGCWHTSIPTAPSFLNQLSSKGSNQCRDEAY